LRQHEHGVSDWSECSSSLDGEKARKTPGHSLGGHLLYRRHAHMHTWVRLSADCTRQQQAVIGLAAQPIMWWSLWTLKTTGCGLPAGPYGVYGALEGVSYLIVAGFVLASIYSKATTGSGLPAGVSAARPMPT